MRAYFGGAAQPPTSAAITGQARSDQKPILSRSFIRAEARREDNVFMFIWVKVIEPSEKVDQTKMHWTIFPDKVHRLPG